MNQLATENTKALAMADALGMAGVDANDIIIPKILLMQSTSESVGDGKAQVGDILNSETLEVLGGPDKPLEIIPLKNEKVWMVYDLTQSPPAFLRKEDFTPETSKLPFEEIENGVKIRRDLAFSFTVLIKSEADAGAAYPASVLFKRTSSQAGRQLVSLIFRYAATGKNYLDYSAVLGSQKVKADKNTYAGWKVSAGKPLSDTAKKEAYKWFQAVKTKNVVEANTHDDIPF